MPNERRRIQTGNVYHLIFRFIAKEWLIAGAEERATYLRMLGYAFSKSDWRCVSYGLMSSHVHVGALAGAEPLGDLTRRAHAPFGEWVNAKNRRVGAVFMRPSDYLVSPDRVGRMLAYIHNNPVRAGVVGRAAGSDWTSHRAYLGMAAAPPWLHVPLGLSLSGFLDAGAFDDWTNQMPDGRPHLDPAQIDRVQRARAAAREIAEGRPAQLVRPPAVVPSAGQVVETVIRALHVEQPLRGASERTREVVAVRRLVAHAGVTLGVTRGALAKALGISPQAVSKARMHPLEGAALGDALRRALAALERNEAA